jgi:hypothetical protein
VHSATQALVVPSLLIRQAPLLPQSLSEAHVFVQYPLGGPPPKTGLLSDAFTQVSPVAVQSALEAHAAPRVPDAPPPVPPPPEPPTPVVPDELALVVGCADPVLGVLPVLGVPVLVEAAPVPVGVELLPHPEAATAATATLAAKVAIRPSFHPIRTYGQQCLSMR